jgi:hypothetical protein
MIYKSGKRIALAMGKDGWIDGWMDETVFSCLKRTFGRE